MTQEEKKFKIAEACGWIPYPKIKGAFTNPGSSAIFGAPDYFNDLNAIQKAWLSQPRGTRLLIVTTLAAILGLPKGDEDEIGELEEGLFSATADQRAEAFGKTLNLW